MGTHTRRQPGLADALFSPVQQRVLALLYGQPDRRFQSAEIIRLARSGTGAVHRQLARFEQVGLVEVTRSGNQKHYQAKHDSPIFAELHGLVVKTVGVIEPLRAALEPHSSKIRGAFVYGSTAAGGDRTTSDIDVMVISNKLTYTDVYDSLQATEQVLARAVNPTVLTADEWRQKRTRSGSFVARIAAGPKLFVLGGDDDLA